MRLHQAISQSLIASLVGQRHPPGHKEYHATTHRHIRKEHDGYHKALKWRQARNGAGKVKPTPSVVILQILLPQNDLISQIPNHIRIRFHRLQVCKQL